MLYCQLQILILIFIYIYALIMVREVLIELKEMDLLSIKDNGLIWDREYKSMPL